MPIITLVILAGLSCLAPPAFACKQLAKYPEHLWGSTVGWWEPYRIIEIVEAHEQHLVVVVKRNFADNTDVGRRTTLRFVPDESPYAMCPISLEVGDTYLVRSMSRSEPLVIQRFNHLNISSTHRKYDGYLRDLERAQVLPMYVEANTVTYETQSNRVILRGKVQIFYNNSYLFADQVIDDRNANELVAEGVAQPNPDRSSRRVDRLRLPDEFRDTFRSIAIEPRATPWQ